MEQPFIGSSGCSELGGYWPWLILQSPSGSFLSEIKSLMFPFIPVGHLRAARTWSVEDLGVKASLGSSLAVVSLGTNFTRDITQPGGYRVFYRGNNGGLSAHQPREEEARVRNWADGGAFPEIEIVENAGIGALTVRDTAVVEGKAATYVLYQNSSTGFGSGEDGSDLRWISMVWRNDKTGWKQRNPEVLARADDGTRITCLVLERSGYDENQEMMDMGARSKRNRCSFPRLGVVCMELIGLRLGLCLWID